MRDRVELYFTSLIHRIGMDRPSNFDQIVDYLVEDIESSASKEWTSEDLTIAFRRWIEDQTKYQD